MAILENSKGRHKKEKSAEHIKTSKALCLITNTLQNGKAKPGVVAQAYSPRYSWGYGGRLTWAQKLGTRDQPNNVNKSRLKNFK